MNQKPEVYSGNNKTIIDCKRFTCKYNKNHNCTQPGIMINHLGHCWTLKDEW